MTEDETRKVLESAIAKLLARHMGQLVDMLEDLTIQRIDYVLLIRDADGNTMHVASLMEEEQIAVMEKAIEITKQGNLLHAFTRNGEIVSELAKREPKH